MRPEWAKWLKANKHDLAPLTGTDTRALRAIDACWELYATTHSTHAIDAVRELLYLLQAKNHHLARELIARSMDWPDREKLWPLVTSA